jgi:hypothetical protein
VNLSTIIDGKRHELVVTGEKNSKTWELANLHFIGDVSKSDTALEGVKITTFWTGISASSSVAGNIRVVTHSLQAYPDQYHCEEIVNQRNQLWLMPII